MFILTIGGSLQTAILICLLKSSRYSGISDFVRGFLAIGLFMAPEKLVPMAEKLVLGIIRFGHCLYEWSWSFWHVILLHLSVIGFCVFGMLAVVWRSSCFSLSTRG